MAINPRNQFNQSQRNLNVSSSGSLTSPLATTNGSAPSSPLPLSASSSSSSIPSSPSSNNGTHAATANATHFSLKVWVMNAQNLAKFDLMGLSDPFVTVSLIDEHGSPAKDFTHTTKVVKSNLNPEWKELFTFDNIPNGSARKMEFAVYDWDRSSKAEFMGGVYLPSPLLRRIGHHEEDILTLRTKLVSRVLPNGIGSEPVESRLQGNLFFIIGAVDADISTLIPLQLNPPCIPMPFDDNGNEGRKFDRTKSGVGTFGRRHNTIGRHNGTEEFKDKPDDTISATDDEEKRSEKDEIDSPEKIERRKKIREEILSTEQSYTQSVGALYSSWVVPLKATASNIGLTDEQVSHMCINIETLHSFHEQFLRELKANPDSPSKIITKYADLFKMYTLYLNGYEKCLSAINALRTHKKFTEFMVTTGKKLKSAPGGLDLMSYMIQPVQRVPRYVLLLRELKRNTTSADPEYHDIKEALGKIQKIAAAINEAKRQMENMSKLLEVQNRISGSMKGTTLLQPHRRLIREGPLQSISTKSLFGSIKMSNRVFFLFSDILLWTGVDFEFKGVLNLAAASIAEESKKTRCGFEINTSTKSIILHCKDDTEKQSWLTEIKAVVNELQASRDAQRNIKSDQLQKKKATLHGDRMNINSLITNRLHSLSLHPPGSAEHAAEEAAAAAAAAADGTDASSGHASAPAPLPVSYTGRVSSSSIGGASSSSSSSSSSNATANVPLPVAPPNVALATGSRPVRQVATRAARRTAGNDDAH